MTTISNETSNSKQNEPEVLKIQKIFENKSLTIPDYQRPYKWQAQHVNQLLDDLREYYLKNKKLIYRIGTIILHSNNKGENAIVDGQQRLSTLALLLHHLNANCVKDYIEKQKFKHSISFKNILQNNRIIEDYCKKYTLNGDEDFLGYILKQCEMVVICLNDIDEAFQFFDSQNARGKSLAPYDLLKAYHLRAYENEYKDFLFGSVKDWEKAVDPENINEPSLNLIISQLLFRIKRWQEQKEGESFTAKELYVFKGIGDEDYPYSKIIRKEYKNSPKEFAHQINYPIFNGKFFFDYIEHYLDLYKEIFHREKGLLKDFYQKLKNYNGWYRIGDNYVRNLFVCAVLFYADKFGTENSTDNKDELYHFAKLAAQWAYWLRFKYTRVTYPTIENYVKDLSGLLFHLVRSKTTREVFQYQIKPFEFKFENCEGLMETLGVENGK